MMTSHIDLIDLWPSIRDFGSDLGVEYNTAKHIRRRGVIPARYWAAAIAGAQRRQIAGVTAEILIYCVAKSKAPRVSPRSEDRAA